MKILFCNITYLNYYDGRTMGENKPTTGGQWVKEHEDAYEKWNFLSVNGNCYGYVQGRNQMHIEKISRENRNKNKAEDVLVVWCASHPTRGTVVIGWYEHAEVYRYLNNTSADPFTGKDHPYWFKVKAENSYLMPEEERVVSIARASQEGPGTGFGQQNYWYADSEYAKEKVIPKVLNFIEEKRANRINQI